MNEAIVDFEWEGEVHKIVVMVEPQTDEFFIFGRLNDAKLWSNNDAWRKLLETKE